VRFVLVESPEEPRLQTEELDLFETGIAQFNGGRFFECHDTLEELWAGIRGPSRPFFQGLIQVSVAFYHLTNGNFAGAESLLLRALANLKRYPDRYLGVDLASLRPTLERRLVKVRSRDVGSLADLPKYSYSGRL